MKKKLLWISGWTFILGFILMYLNFQLVYFLGIAAIFVFTLWQMPKASGEYSDEEYAYEKRRTIWTLSIAAAYISAGFLALILQTFVL
ncbi:hypothetical protein SAMN04488102_103164 [Alkalibacterium subtropicum]|uniref:Uncharacterized protein n=1 Tax=Alkalibacterium subtropicum TaxID=753702 RepID=A0A1I1GTJ9_9LACT|nr:hypothetical protein [Alkalibacterium subtropicum]SFC13178.1 hypothetical protein SAMN04488102_103164 [Alkalibacterium subtropicum]